MFVYQTKAKDSSSKEVEALVIKFDTNGINTPIDDPLNATLSTKDVVVWQDSNGVAHARIGKKKIDGDAQ